MVQGINRASGAVVPSTHPPESRVRRSGGPASGALRVPVARIHCMIRYARDQDVVRRRCHGNVSWRAVGGGYLWRARWGVIGEWKREKLVVLKTMVGRQCREGGIAEASHWTLPVLAVYKGGEVLMMPTDRILRTLSRPLPTRWYWRLGCDVDVMQLGWCNVARLPLKKKKKKPSCCRDTSPDNTALSHSIPFGMVLQVRTRCAVFSHFDFRRRSYKVPSACHRQSYVCEHTHQHCKSGTKTASAVRHALGAGLFQCILHNGRESYHVLGFNSGSSFGLAFKLSSPFEPTGDEHNDVARSCRDRTHPGVM